MGQWLIADLSIRRDLILAFPWWARPTAVWNCDAYLMGGFDPNGSVDPDHFGLGVIRRRMA